MKRSVGVLAFILLLLLASCQNEVAGGGRELGEGRIVLWHGWTGEEATALQTALSDFNEIYPNITVVDVAVPADELLFRFQDVGDDGVGPDLIIGNANWIAALADQGIIQPHPGADAVPMSTLAREAVSYEDRTFGLPMFVAPYALYFNRSMVEKPPTTLNELLVETSNGNRVAFVPRFREAYWGIQAFGEDLFTDEGVLDLASSGFISWLKWLKVVQNEPGVIMNVDDESLHELFVEGELAYYVAEPRKIDSLSKALGDDLAVSILPSGPHSSAGPLLPVETILFYEHSSSQQAEMARILGEFLYNIQQSVFFMRELSKVPANPNVAVDSRVYPLISGFSRQARTAVVMPKTVDYEELVRAGDRVYAAVLAGELSPEEAVCRFGLDLASEQELEEGRVILPKGCKLPEANGES